MALTSIFPAKFALKPVFYRQSNPGDVVSNDVLAAQAERELQGEYEQGFFVDASVNEDYDHSVMVSRNPVERGIDVSDSAKVQPMSISMTMRHSDTPIRLTDVFTGIGTTLGAQLGQQVGPLATQVGGVAAGAFTGMLRNGRVNNRTRSKTMYDQFVSLLNNRAVMTIQTGLSVYRDMIIERLQVNRTSGDGKSLKFTVVLTQVRIIDSEFIKDSAPQREVKVADKAKKKADLGRISTNGISAEQSKSFSESLNQYYPNRFTLP